MHDAGHVRGLERDLAARRHAAPSGSVPSEKTSTMFGWPI